jgi:hypothetical protein
MRELLRVEGLDEWAACSLVDRVADTLPARHEPNGRELGSVAIDAAPAGTRLGSS